jgi:hypothetical protein
VGGHEHRHPAAVLLPFQHVEEPRPRLGIEAGKGLVDQQQVGLGRQHRCDGHPMLLSEAEAEGRTLAMGSEATQVEHFLYAPPYRQLGVTHATQRKRELVADGSLEEVALRVLEQEPCSWVKSLAESLAKSPVGSARDCVSGGTGSG